MSKYIDGFVLPVPKDKIEQYRSIASKAAAIWKEHGALEYIECVGEDMTGMSDLVRFPDLAKAAPEETVVFSWIAYRSRAHRDEVNGKVMADPRMKEMCGGENSPFDYRRMAYGGFEAIVEA